ncbi:MAG TPA: thioesterase domain-containing protein, partial [Trichocoleus sp.]
NSSYTGAPIPAEEMREWLCDRTTQLLALKPQRILEIGCGTGLILSALLPHCEKYWATDFSQASLAAIQQQLAGQPETAAKVMLLHRLANDFQGIPAAEFDLVILNSVVQYFPSLDYLMQVLEGAVNAVAPGGALFIGDVRSLPLLKTFHAWAQFCQADAGLERDDLRQRVMRSHFEEPELALDPALFTALSQRFPRIRQVQIRLTRGRSQNEMTQFRYNVLLHMEGGSKTGDWDTSGEIGMVAPTVEWLDWSHQPLTVDEIHRRLLQAQPPILGLANVANQRVWAALQVEDWLSQAALPKTVGRMREQLQALEPPHLAAIDPQDWWDLASALPYRVEISWSITAHSDADGGAYSVLFIHKDVPTPTALLPSPPTQDWYSYANSPLQSQLARQLIPELRHHLGQTLPAYMVPAAFVPLEALPVNTNGKIDRRALPPLEISSDRALQEPEQLSLSSPTEAALVEIWQDLLRVRQVGRHDSFFDLGGHSLLATQMASRVHDAFGIELPLRSVFESPTVAQLAPLIESLRSTGSSSQAPALVKLDRAAHRQVRRSKTGSQEPLQLGSSPQPSSAAVSELAEPSVLEVEPPSPEASVNEHSPLVPLTLGSQEPPFFLVHPIFGVVFPYLELAQRLQFLSPSGSGPSIYGVQPRGLEGDLPPLQQIEPMAAHYLQAIQAVQPQGPYRLGGWSFGGLVAFEMAQQLQQAGETVSLLAILDSPAPAADASPSLGKRLKFLLGTAVWSTLPFLLDYGAIATTLTTPNHQPRRGFKRWLARQHGGAIANLLPPESRLKLLDEAAILRILKVFYANSQAAYRYQPQPYSGPVTLFKAAEQPDFGPKDPTLGWDRLTESVQVHTVPGNHLSMMKPPQVEMLAEQLQPYL